MLILERILASFSLIAFISVSLFAQVPGPDAGIGISEHLGAFVPLDLSFQNEKGDSVFLRQLITKPTIVSLVYYRCPSICKPLLSGVAEVLSKVDMAPAKDYSVITISFDSSDRPEDSRRMKKNYLSTFDKAFPEDSWRFLTGDSASIVEFTQAVGFNFKRRGSDFVHPASLVILSPKGKIVRYLYGIQYLPLDLKMALIEASKGKVGPTIAKVLLFCFSYDSEGKKYVLNITRIVGAGVIVTALLFASFLFITEKRRKKG